MKNQFTITSLFMLLCIFQIQAQVFVKHNATGSNDGTSWANAFTDLEAAITSTTANDQVWVAAGTYKPGGDTATVDVFFTFPHDLELYGGFAGTETMLSERDWTNNETILSGDHSGNDIDNNFDDNKTDNSYHVMWLTDTITSVTIIDGLSIKYGNTQPSSGSGNNRRAGGILSYGAPTIKNCLFTQNYGYFAGAFYARLPAAQDFSLENCVFMNNNGGSGGAIYNNSGGGVITDCTFTGNESANRGAAIYNSNSNTDYTNCNFTSNTSASTSGALYINGPDDEAITVNITNCNFSENSSATYGGALAIYDSTTTANVIDCTFDFNNAMVNGGAISIAFQGTGNFSNSTFTNNQAPNGIGGVVYLQTQNSKANIDNCDFSLNGAERGGVIANNGSVVPLDSLPLIQITINNSFFQLNSAVEQGGAINTSNTNLSLTNCVIDGNFTTNTDGIGGGISLNTVDSINANYSLLNCTVANNSASIGAGISHWKDGAESSSTLTLQNTILYNPLGNNYEIEAGDPVLISNGGNLSSDLSSTELTATSDINDEDPLFTDADDSDFHLLDGSPCIDAGIATGAPLQDIEGNDRVDAIDMGAFENQKLVGINNPVELFGELNVFPNPAEKDLHFSFSDQWNGLIKIQIFDTQGKMISTQWIEKQSNQINRVLNVTNLSEGLYYLHLSNGAKVNSKSFLKK